MYERTKPGRHPVTYGGSLHKGTGAVPGVNKMNISPTSIRFTRPTHGHLSPKQIRAEIYGLLLVASSLRRHDATYVGKQNKYQGRRDRAYRNKTRPCLPKHVSIQRRRSKSEVTLSSVTLWCGSFQLIQKETRTKKKKKIYFKVIL